MLLYLHSLRLRGGIVTEFGRSPEALRDVLVSCARLAITAADDQDLAEACRHLLECRQLLDEIIARGWADAQTTQVQAWIEARFSEWNCGA
ncbi:MAG: hypothetical protein J5I93_25255 [Pirellulaceae bacterium]|nr:hypothetical protein [Pirellulaceae bacterium]